MAAPARGGNYLRQNYGHALTTSLLRSGNTIRGGCCIAQCCQLACDAFQERLAARN
jgi:hypothetical protein